MRLIDADALEKTGITFETHGGAIFIALGSVRTAPAIDAVPIVRCKDCKHSEKVGNARWCRVWRGYNGMGDDGFCSYGERMVEDAAD